VVLRHVILHPLSEQDEDTAELDKAEVIERVTLIAHDQTPEGAEPREEALNLPAPLVAPQRAAILRFGTSAMSASSKGSAS
jgi:hypothetical protein